MTNPRGRPSTHPGVTGLVRLVAVASIGLVSACSSAGSPAMASMPVPEGVTVEVSERTFAVLGRTTRDIWESLNRRGPANENRIVWGLHSWRFNWNTQWDTSGEGCRVGDLQIRMSTEITMPDWRQRGGSDPELQEMWDEFERQLREHEDTHRDYALEAIRDLDRAIRSAQAPDCETAGRRIRAQASVIMERYRELNSSFDRRASVPWPPWR